MSYYDNILEIDSNLDGNGLCIGIVMSRFNIDVSEGLLGACTAELTRLGVQEADIVLTTVPGALEIPVALQKLAESDRFDALIALGAVIRGETYHFEVVANESARGLAAVGREYNIQSQTVFSRPMMKIRRLPAWLKRGDSTCRDRNGQPGADP